MGSEVVINFAAADIRLTAEFTEGEWRVDCWDMFTGAKENALWDYKTLGAVLFLMAGTGEEEGTDQELTELMYKIAEPAIKDWKARPIP